MNTIHIIGLGNGGLDACPYGIVKQLETIQQAYVRTMNHPIIEELKALHDLDDSWVSFDSVYEQHDDFEDVYQAIVKTLVDAVENGDVYYILPGHPMILEETTQRLLKYQNDQFEVNVVGGRSFYDDVFNAMQIDPVKGFLSIDAMHYTPIQFNIHNDTLVTQVYDQFILSDLKVDLLEHYPAEHTVYIIMDAGIETEVVNSVPLCEIDHEPFVSNLAVLFIPRVTEEVDKYKDIHYSQLLFNQLVSDDGCPWDREQTNESILKYLIEESYELSEAVIQEDDEAITDELGDVLLQVMLHCAIGEKEGYFTLNEVIHKMNDKVVRRHPHVFGSEQATSTDEVNAIWEAKKREEGLFVERTKYEKDYANFIFPRMYETITKGIKPERLLLKQQSLNGLNNDEKGKEK